MRETVAFAALLCGIFCLNSQPVLADDGVTRIKNNTLEHVGWYKAPIEVQITDDGPKVKDLRRQEVNRNFDIRIRPLPPAQESTTVIDPDGPGNSVGGMQTGAPATIRINANRPPRSGFESNIPSSGPRRPSGLPDGSTTNRLANQPLAQGFVQGSMLHPAVSKPKPANASKPAIPPKTVTYDDPAASASGFSGSSSHSLVIGTLLAPQKAHH
jgi:hypothetical protein